MPEIRNEKPEEYRETEELVRKSFMGVYQPLSSEHLILHKLRKAVIMTVSFPVLCWKTEKL